MRIHHKNYKVYECPRHFSKSIDQKVGFCYNCLEDILFFPWSFLIFTVYGTKHIMEKMVEEGHETFSSVLVCGGLSKNPLFVETQANVSLMPVLVPHEAESVLLGAAILGATASGIYDSVLSAIGSMAGKAEVISPDYSLQRFHDMKYKVFRKLSDDQLSYRKIMSNFEMLVTG